MLIYSEGGTKAQEDEAEDILGVLSLAYPGHPWGVRVYDGGFFIRHLAFPANWGMNYRGSKSSYSASALKRQIIMLAGEWLERAGVSRARYDADQELVHVEGVPDNAQPHQALTDDVKLVMADGHTPMRSSPRPQAVKGD